MKKTALILGEKNYQYVNPLNNTINDALDISDSLRKIGYEVNVYTDSDLKTMSAAINQWCSKLSSYNVALFYFSGHGAEYNSENYLFPIDANPKSPNDMSSHCLSANELLARIDNSNVRYNIMILDACRSNPFTKSWVRNFSSGGLAAMTGKGSFIGYAASANKTASDGIGRNGTYTEAILKYITIPGLTIDQIFTKVNSYVRTATKETQIPFKNSSLSSDYCFSVKRSKQNYNKPEITFIQPPSEALLTNDQSFLINTTDSGILIKDASTLNNLQSIKTSLSRPLVITSKTGENVVVVDAKTMNLFNVDTKRKVVASSIPLDHTPTGIALCNLEDKAYVSFNDGQVGGIYLIDLSKGKILKATNLKNSPVAILLSNDDKRLFLLSKDSLFVIDASNGKYIKSIRLDYSGKSIGLSPDNKTILVGCEKDNTGNTQILDATSLKLKKTLGFHTNLFSFTSDNINVLAVSLKELFVIDLRSLAIINRVPFNSLLKGIATSTDGTANIWLPSENRFYIYRIDQLTTSNTIDPEIKLKEFKEVAKNDYLQEMNKYNNVKLFFDTLKNVYEDAVISIKNELGSAFQTPGKFGLKVIRSGDSVGFKYNIKEFGDRFGIYAFNQSKKIMTHFIGKISDKEFILKIYEEPRKENLPEIYRSPKSDLDWREVSAFVRKYFLMRLDQLRE